MEEKLFISMYQDCGSENVEYDSFKIKNFSFKI